MIDISTKNVYANNSALSAEINGSKENIEIMLCEFYEKEPKYYKLFETVLKTLDKFIELPYDPVKLLGGIPDEFLFKISLSENKLAFELNTNVIACMTVFSVIMAKNVFFRQCVIESLQLYDAMTDEDRYNKLIEDYKLNNPGNN